MSASLGLGRSCPESVGAEGVFRQGAFRSLLSGLLLIYWERAIEASLSELAELFWGIRPSPSMYRRKINRPREGIGKLQFPLSYLALYHRCSQSAAALHGLFFGDSEAGVDPGVLLGKLGLLNQVALVV